MQNIPWQRWAYTFIVLILLGLAADYFFLHTLFPHARLNTVAPAEPTKIVEASAPKSSEADTTQNSEMALSAGSQKEPGGENNFLKSLQACRADMTAQGVATPEALLAYLQKSIGKVSEIKEVENYHVKLPDGSERRLHMIPSDKENSGDHVELRYFKLDAQGYPEKIQLKPEESLDPKAEFIHSLLSQGEVNYHQIRSIAKLKDESTLSLDIRDDKVFEFQWRGSDHTLSCRQLNCQCK